MSQNKLTRAQLAEAVVRESNYHRLHLPGGEKLALRAAAFELLKSCATCRYFGVRTLAETGDTAVEAHWCHDEPREVPPDGFCHRWAQ